jgi:hypothetical protein
MNFVYLDPPYLGCSALYPEHSDAKKWDSPQSHWDLIGRTVQQAKEEKIDGWALSCSSSSLHTLLPFCPEDVRIMSWVKPFCAWRGSVNPAFAWEPVIMWGGRNRKKEKPKVLDWISANAPIQKGTAGAKPLEFWFWLFRCWGARQEDNFIDIFPGSGLGTRAWTCYTSQLDFTATY